MARPASHRSNIAPYNEAWKEATDMQESAILVGASSATSPIVESCLNELQLDVVVAKGGADALRVLEPEGHALVVCDLPLADMAPATIVSQIRRTSRAVSIILLAGPPHGPDLAEVVQTGADEYVARPPDRARLIEAIARGLAQRRLVLQAQLAPATRSYQADIPSKRLLLEAIEALVRCLEVKDVLSNGHARNVGAIAAKLGARLGLSEAEVQELRLASFLHDLGKVAVSQEILDKPGTLSPMEWQEVKRHPETGAEILSSIGRLSDIARYVKHHHERHDGQGYPDGLRGSQIPLTSRIIAVADAYDAMVSPRPYRYCGGLAYAAREFKVHAGTQWDREVVDGLFACLPKLAAAG